LGGRPLSVLGVGKVGGHGRLLVAIPGFFIVM